MRHPCPQSLIDKMTVIFMQLNEIVLIEILHWVINDFGFDAVFNVPQMLMFHGQMTGPS